MTPGTIECRARASDEVCFLHRRQGHVVEHRRELAPVACAALWVAGKVARAELRVEPEFGGQLEKDRRAELRPLRDVQPPQIGGPFRAYRSAAAFVIG